MARTLLLIWITFKPVGHVVEALKVAKGYTEANDDLAVHVMLRDQTAWQLATRCDWIEDVYPVTLPGFPERPWSVRTADVPKEWDYIVLDPRLLYPGLHPKALSTFRDTLLSQFSARSGIGYADCFHELFGVHQPSVLPYVRNAPISIPVARTEEERFSQKIDLDVPRCTIIPAGAGSQAKSPSTKTWIRICEALSTELPELELAFTGLTKGRGRGTATRGFTRGALERTLDAIPRGRDYFDIGLWDQLALLEASEFVLAPHTGFAFLASAVGTPWLALSACPWPEYLFNDTPFYSVLPDCGSYPAALHDRHNGCGRLLREGKRTRCMLDARFEAQLREITGAAKLLFDRDLSYEGAVDLHLRKLSEGELLDRDCFYFFDGTEALDPANRQPSGQTKQT